MPRGTLAVHAEGYGFVQTAEGEFFIPASKLGGAFDGDLVEVSPLPSSASKSFRATERGSMRMRGRPAARIVRVIERAHESLVGRYEVADPFGVVVPEDPRIPYDVFTQRSAAPDIPHGALVRVRITTYPSRNTAATGVVEEVLGEADEPRIGVESIIARHKLETRFTDACLEEAGALRLDVEAALSKGYADLRDRCIFTIDPIDARDFDDALSLERIEDGRAAAGDRCGVPVLCGSGWEGAGASEWRLGVHIADVSAYVPWGCAIDLDARNRATSAYLVDRVIPMLPERLSNDLCSLRPEEDRLTMTVDLHLDGKGRVSRYEVYPAVIRSKARLTYGEVQEWLDGFDSRDIAPHPNDADALAALGECSPLLLRLSGQNRAENSLEMSRTPQKFDWDDADCQESCKTTSSTHVDCPEGGKITCSCRSGGGEDGCGAAGEAASGRKADNGTPSAREAASVEPQTHGAGIPRQVADRLAPLSRIGKLRAELRRLAGGIDFPSTEAKVRLDADGRPAGVDLRRKTDATSLVEEAMILANEAVARCLVAAGSPGLFRVHERPAADGLAGLIPVLEEFDWFARIDKTRFAMGDPHAVQAALEASRQRSEGELVGSLLLRAMKRADYRASCEGHYGLASEAYAHFTSPIRRYPDLVVHRMLKALLFGRPELHDQEASALRWLGRHCSEREREVDAAARESQELKLIELLESQVGQAFSAVVSGVAAYGLYVRLDNTAEGLLPVRRLGAEYYSLDADLHRLVGQDSGKVWRLGQRIAVVLTVADVRRHVLEFRLAGDAC